MKRQDKLELVFASLIAVSVIVSLIFAIAIVSPEQGVLQGTQSTAATTNSVQGSVSISTDTIVTVMTQTTATTLTFSHTSVIPTFSTQVITYTTQSTETLRFFSTVTSTASQASTTTDSQLTSQSFSTTVSTTAAVITTTYTTTPIATTSTSTTISKSTTTSTSSTTDSTTTANSAVATTLTLSCSPSEFQLGLSSVCTATVTSTNWQYPPTGLVSFSSTLPATFTPASCTLKGSGSAFCMSTFTPKGPTTGYYTVTANYLGDAGHFGSSGTVTLIVPPPASTLVSCFPSTLTVNSITFCMVTVQNTQDFPTPTGTITLTSNMPGTFDKASCTLDASASCSVHYTPGTGSAGHTTTITGTYSGDLYHAPSAGTAQLTIT